MERPEKTLARISYALRMRRLTNWIAEHRDELLRTVTLGYADFREWQFHQRAVSPRSYDFVIVNLLETAKQIVQIKAQSGMWLEGAETIVALERYRLKNGSYPETLDALVPDFLKSVPRDIYVPEKPLLYGRDNDNYHLYSVGENRIDNGGVAKFGKASVALNEDVVMHWPTSLSSVR